MLLSASTYGMIAIEMQTRAFKGHVLRAARNAKGYSQSELGGRIGAHVTSISDWERGDNAPSGRHVVSLSRELAVPVEHFYGDEDDEEADPVSDLFKALDRFFDHKVKGGRP